MFFCDSVQWHCGCSSFCEDLITYPPRKRARLKVNEDMDVLVKRFPDFNGYKELVRKYNSRKLTHAEDAVSL